MNLQRDTVIKEGIYTDLIKQMENNKIRQAMDSMDIQIVDRANLPFTEKPVWPKKRLIIMMGVIFGFMISFVYSLRLSRIKE